MAILEYSRIMVNCAIEAMRNAYTADFELFHHHHDPELEASSGPGLHASAKETEGTLDPASPAGASAAHQKAVEAEAQERVRARQPPPAATPDLLGARIYLEDPSLESTESPALAIVVGFHPPDHTHEIIVKLASGKRRDLTWQEFKTARRNLFGKDLSGMAVPAWGPDDSLPSAEVSRGKNKDAAPSSEEESESELSTPSDDEEEADSRKRAQASTTPHGGMQRVRSKTSKYKLSATDLVGKRVRKKFGKTFYTRVVTASLPPQEKDEEWLWQIDYDDGDTEQVNRRQLGQIMTNS